MRAKRCLHFNYKNRSNDPYASNPSVALRMPRLSSLTAHYLCESLLFLVLQETSAISDRRAIAIRRNCGLRLLSQRRTLMDVIGRLRTDASSIPLTLASQEAMRVVASVRSRRSLLVMSEAR